ncbi:hypothetical protein ANANG_G00289380 [Anguilla anguilla]|uniref:SEA domain-containing protein n=1 Tax=Anguilla anguilla TaxID=7936 RepID=A0A9D3LJS4_ANGAN|nr:hypothetical protein ANANG_G00289380 [Anguilla anguilla]
METTAPSTSGSTTPTGGPTAANISSSTPSTAPNSSASTPATGSPTAANISSSTPTVPRTSGSTPPTVPSPSASTHPTVPSSSASTHPTVPSSSASTHLTAPSPSASTHPTVPSPSASTHPTVPSPSASTHPTVPSSSVSTHPTVPSSSASTHPTVPSSSASTHPTVPSSSASTHPTVPSPSASTHPTVPSPSASTHPTVPSSSVSTHPTVPSSSASTHPTVPSPSASTHPTVPSSSASTHPTVPSSSASTHPTVPSSSVSTHPTVPSSSVSTHPTVPSSSVSTHPTVPSPSASTHPTVPSSSASTHPTVPSSSASTHPTVPSSSASTPTESTLTTVRPAGFCFSNPCPFDSICEELFMSFRCLCLPGSFYSSTERSCVQARVFPGRLRLTSLQFQDEMANTSSPIFLRTSQDISRTLEESLRGQPGYVRSTVLQLSRGSVVATVDNVFSLASNVTQATASAAIMEAIQGCGENCILKGAEFNETDLCSQVPGPCDTMTTSCNLSGGIPACTCKPGHLKTLYSNKSCTACPSGSKAEDGKCVACPFGYAGFNCNDSSLLAVVVISCVLGGVLLILLLAFIISYCCWKKKDPTYSSPYPAEDAGPTSSWSNRQIIPIPRASLHWDSSQMELTENRNAGRKSHGNGSTGSYDVSKVNLSTFKDENPARYSYLAQGHENPYFLAEDERKGK